MLAKSSNQLTFPRQSNGGTTSVALIEASSPEKRERDSDIVEVDLDEYNDAEILLLIAVKTVAQSVGFAEQLQDFDQCYEFSRLNKGDDSLRAPKSKKSQTDYFSS